MKNYIVATVKDWNIAAFHAQAARLPGRWNLVTCKEDLTPDLIQRLKPRYIFFPHWSWIVPDEILQAAECVCFHMADVPYGRGGSPLQNLIVRGHRETKLTALRMTGELDAGPVYKKTDLSLTGAAQDIYGRAACLVYDLIDFIVKNEPDPVPQTGQPVIFKRRTPAMSVLPAESSTPDLYDHIRMLDAETYPRAFLEYGNFILTFSQAVLQEDGTVRAQVIIGQKK